jgi:hypothetical protein
MGANPSGRRHIERVKRQKRDAQRIAAKQAAAARAKPKPAAK